MLTGQAGLAGLPGLAALAGLAELAGLAGLGGLAEQATFNFEARSWKLEKTEDGRWKIEFRK